MAGNYGKKKTTKQNQLQKRREIQMEKIENSEISLEAYLHSIGTMTFHYDKRVTKSKPVDPVSDDEEQTSETNITIIKRIVIPASLDLASFMPKTSKDKVDKEPAKNISKIDQPSLPNVSVQGAKLREKRKKSSLVEKCCQEHTQKFLVL